MSWGLQAFVKQNPLHAVAVDITQRIAAMATCECLSGCIFFNDRMASMPVLAERWKQKFCLGDHAVCARHQVLAALGRGNVPPDLYPNQADRARQLMGH